MLDLIYCAGGNPRLSQIAYDAGYLLGVRSDKTPCTELPQQFIDIDYQRPHFAKHRDVVIRHRPRYATVPDLSEHHVDQADIKRACEQAEQIAAYCEVVLLVPKLPGQLALIPRACAIGYSVPSSYGGAQYPLWELAGRRVHLLGGSPKKQWEAYRYLSAIAEVISADGNYAQKMATRYAEFWQAGRWHDHPDARQGKKDVYFDCWQRSCHNIRREWQQVSGG